MAVGTGGGDEHDDDATDSGDGDGDDVADRVFMCCIEPVKISNG